MRRLDDIINLKDMSLSKLRDKVNDGEAWQAAIHGVAELDMTDRLNNNNNIQAGRSQSMNDPETLAAALNAAKKEYRGT